MTSRPKRERRVAAVVVTFNRLELLKRCLEAVRDQTRPVDGIIVVDNGSTDGTAAWLDAEPGLTVIHQENLGGAGGFHCGFGAAYDAGYDWSWAMDDDGWPHDDVLENFERAITDGLRRWKIVNCYVYHGAAPVDGPRNLAARESLRRKGPYAFTGAAPFNGTFIHRTALEEVGNVNPELFIWGDEVNYFMRCVRHYGAFPVALDCLHYHPRFAVTRGMPRWKLYYMVRNQVFNALTLSRFGPLGVLYVIARHLRLVAAGYLPVRVFAVGLYAGLARRLGRNHESFGFGTEGP